MVDVIRGKWQQKLVCNPRNLAESGGKHTKRTVRSQHQKKALYLVCSCPVKHRFRQNVFHNVSKTIPYLVFKCESFIWKAWCLPTQIALYVWDLFRWLGIQPCSLLLHHSVVRWYALDQRRPTKIRSWTARLLEKIKEPFQSQVCRTKSNKLGFWIFRCNEPESGRGL